MFTPRHHLSSPCVDVSFLARSAHLVASLTLAPAAADSTQHRPSSGRLIFSPAHVLYCCFSALRVCTCFVSIQHPTLMVAARPAVVRYTPDHSHGPSRCQESDRPTSVVYALLIYLPASDSQERRGDAMRKLVQWASALGQDRATSRRFEEDGGHCPLSPPRLVQRRKSSSDSTWALSSQRTQT